MAATDTTRSAATGAALGFSTLDREVRLDSLPVEGVLPPWLAGSLLRTGPAQFEAGDQKLNHWFDGLAMLHRFSFEGGRVSYANRFLHSRAYRAVQETGKLGYGEFATDPCRSLFGRVTSMFRPHFSDNGAVNVSRVDDEFIAMTETPLPVVFDPETLEAAGVAYEAPGHLSTAHPHHDPQSGELLNYAAKLGPRSTYRFYGQRSREEQRPIASIPVRKPAYVHSFGLTDRFLILAEGPFVVDPMRLATGGRPYIENYTWEPERGGRFHVVDRATGEVRGPYVSDPFFTFHHINAFEDGGSLVVDLCAYEDASIIDALYLDRLRGGGDIPSVRARRFTIDLDGGSVSSRDLYDGNFELPRIAYRTHNGRPYRYAYGIGGEGTWASRVVKLDVEDGTDTHWAADGCFPGEPVFVPEPGAEAEDAGVLLSVVLDAARGTSFLLVLDSGDLSELARAEVPHHIPFSFHGQFFRA
ncbi:MAG: beta,beta-carotene 9,10-dioxygenase [Solirubrobacteraceae bacterium]|nr:beta,beta-carotene 9,10-dioxygenase [Solirubrobacteraceae bacterium]